SVYVMGSAFYRLDPATGVVRDSMVEDSLRVGWPFDIDWTDKDLLTYSSDREGFRLVAVDQALTRVRWRHRPPRGRTWASLRPFVWRGFVLAGTDSGGVLAYRIDDGTFAWSVQVHGVLRNFTADAERLYITNQSGEITVFKPQQMAGSPPSRRRRSGRTTQRTRAARTSTSPRRRRPPCRRRPPPRPPPARA